MGNIGCSLFSGMPASGSLTRSTLNIQSGAKTGVSNLLAGFLVLAGCLLGSSVNYIPVPALATLVIFIGASLIKEGKYKLYQEPRDRCNYIYSNIISRVYFFIASGNFCRCHNLDSLVSQKGCGT